ncbi:MAG: triphosphoribosyl-dephospho-CoA synthase [Candidatus Hydrothermarchaeales archaeon]
MKLEDIATYAQLACVLEVSCPKPGNVSRYHDFDDTKYEHFLVSGIAIGKAVEDATIGGYRAENGEIGINSIGLGSLIKKAVTESRDIHSGGNTNLGISMLLIPLAAAAGMTMAQGNYSNEQIRENIDRVVKNTTCSDTVALYDAIKSLKPSWLDKVKFLDINNEQSLTTIEEQNLSLFDVMNYSKQDTIAKELTTKFEISFTVGYPRIVEIFDGTNDINQAILTCFMTILSKYEDSLIVKKNGYKVAQEISAIAREILDNGLDPTEIENFDKKLRNNGNRLNPGTTADLVTSSLMISFLNNLKI